jgi:nucleoside-diphosphate-sugar epimerase
MTLTAFQKSRIIVMGGGLQWRPLVHVSDVSRAFMTVISSEQDLVNEEIFNIGLDNFQIKNLAYLVREEIPFPVDIETAPDDADKRDYNVVFQKAKEKIGFSAKVDVIHGIKEIYLGLKSGKVDVGQKTITVQWYRNIIEAKKLIQSVELNGRVI